MCRHQYLKSVVIITGPGPASYIYPTSCTILKYTCMQERLNSPGLAGIYSHHPLLQQLDALWVLKAWDLPFTEEWH